MKNHVSLDNLEKYRERKLAGDDLVSVANHLASCAVCRKALSPMIAEISLMERVDVSASQSIGDGDMEHLSYERLQGSLDGSLTDNENAAVASHLELCAVCRGEQEDMRGFRALMSSYPDVSYTPSTSAPAKRAKPGSVWQAVTVWAVAAAAVSVLILEMTHHPKTAAVGPKPAIVQPIQGASREHMASVPKKTVPAEIKPPKKPTVRVAASDVPPIVQTVPVPNEHLSADAQSYLDAAKVDSSTLQMLHGLSVDDHLTGGPESDTVHLRSPAAAVIEDEEPAFTWDQYKTATGYEVTVWDPAAGDADNLPVVKSEIVTDTTWTPPNPLPRGKVLAWRVKALGGEDVTSKPAKFMIVDEDAGKNIVAADNADDYLSLGILYAQSGLLAQSRKALHTYLHLHPDSPNAAQAKKLLRSVTENGGDGD